MARSNRDAANTLATYYNYVNAWALALERDHGIPQIAKRAFLQRQESINAFSKLRRRNSYPHALTSPYCRGLLTLRSMQLPIERFPVLAPTVNLWLPVQAYYAIHGMGIAALIGLGYDVPTNHRAYRAAFAESLSRYFPFPFNAICRDGPRSNNFTFGNLHISAQDVASQSNLAAPSISNAEFFVGKSLSTTRRNLLEEQYEKARHRNVAPGRSYRQLNGGEALRISSKLAGTSIVDLLYRMRIRSNYEDPDMYVEALDQPVAASTHYRAFTYLVAMIIEGLRSVIRRTIATQAMADLDLRLRGWWSDST